MRIVVVVLVAAVALTGCGKRFPDRVGTPPPATPTSVRPDPAEVREIEDVVNGLDGVVGSAEADTDTGND
jgi:hypothetical protein